MEKIKQFIESEKGKDILIVFIVILVGLGTFELGRLSNGGSSSGIKIDYPNHQMETQSANVISSTNHLEARPPSGEKTPKPSTSNNFFASSKGSKYYSIGCSAGKTIKPENRIYFATQDEAQKAGYELSSSCQ